MPTASRPSAVPTRSSGDAAAIRARHDVTRLAIAGIRVAKCCQFAPVRARVAKGWAFVG
jgi:hypothetical protein